MSITYRGETFSGYNKPKRTPKHPKKSHAVLAKVGDKIRLIRFGAQGVRGEGKNTKTKIGKARKKAYYARHNAQDSKPSKLSARYWSHKTKWYCVMAVIKPPITGDEIQDSWAFNTTSRLEDIDAVLSSFNLETWTIEEDSVGKIIFSKNGIIKMRLDDSGNLEIAGTLTQSVTF